jgi:hypothetical protein
MQKQFDKLSMIELIICRVALLILSVIALTKIIISDIKPLLEMIK